MCGRIHRKFLLLFQSRKFVSSTFCDRIRRSMIVAARTLVSPRACTLHVHPHNTHRRYTFLTTFFFMSRIFVSHFCLALRKAPQPPRAICILIFQHRSEHRRARTELVRRLPFHSSLTRTTPPSVVPSPNSGVCPSQKQRTRANNIQFKRNITKSIAI